uniref:uncharacterized protein LOC120336902 n=1 Tax=Styela clava TaxID=7725 RepID=UPI00193ACE50|nr:uncharacterized protein LOC120325638 isoform X1 [Styela clava]XP_039260616.1 uncharacterized protein LOC120336902 [Styela clava]
MEVAKLIELVREKNCLWAVGAVDYRNKILKEKAWIEVGEEMGIGVKECKTRWRTSSSVPEDVTLVVYENEGDIQDQRQVQEKLEESSSSFDIDQAILRLVNKEQDDAEIFAQSLVQTFRRLPNKKFQQAKIEIQEVLFHLEFNTD